MSSASAAGSPTVTAAVFGTIGDAAVEHPVICAVDRGMVKGMLGTLYGETSVEVMSSSAGGDERCVTSFDD